MRYEVGMDTIKYKVWALVTILNLASCKCCVEEERLALLSIKEYMQSYSDAAIHWLRNGERYNCCAWDKVKYSPSTGRVTDLHLGDMVEVSSSWLFNVTLFHSFHQLIYLDLSFNGINGFVESHGSTKISTLKKLQYLNLDNNYVTGYISIGDLTSLERLSLRECNVNESSFPLQGLCEMKNLVELNLKENNFGSVLPSCLKNLHSLKVVNLPHNNFNRNLSNVLSTLKSLEYLDLSNNNFEGKFSFVSFANLSKLHVLRLSQNKLQVHFGDSSWQPTFQLQTLGLRGCNLNNTIQTFRNFWSHQTNLSDLDLSQNNLFEPFPTWLLNNSSKLKALYLSNNLLTGSLDELPYFTNYPLHILDISNNNFHGKLPEIGLVFPNLEYLNLSGNHFEGPIPTSITNMRYLRFLDMSNNIFSGKLPTTLLSHCTSLEILQLSDNILEGDIIPENMNLPNLTWLKLRNNRFSGTIKDALLKSSELYHFDISNNSVTGLLPSWIGNLSELYSLSMSQNNMWGEIPKDICRLGVIYLDLSQNHFTGSIPSCSKSCSFAFVHLHSNKLSGKIPDGFISCSMLETLDLRHNHLSGGIPLWIDKLLSLSILLLAGNDLNGLIPHQICMLENINILDLSSNNLSGEIPICIRNMSFGMKSSMPYQFDPIYSDYSLGDDTELDFYDTPEEVVYLVKNQLLSYVGENLVLMSGLDLSCNKLTGYIPPQVGDLEMIHSLNLSHNFLSGSIPTKLSNLKHIESLDLSNNRLDGTIPFNLVELNFLAIFNVSYNNLSGRVPETGQFANFDERNYLGNPRLYGYQVHKMHNQTQALLPPTLEEDEDDGGFYMIYFWWSFGMSCAIMFVATLAILYINPQWRGVWFMFLDSYLRWW